MLVRSRDLEAEVFVGDGRRRALYVAALEEEEEEEEEEEDIVRFFFAVGEVLVEN